MRELENLLYRALALSEGGELELDDVVSPRIAEPAAPGVSAGPAPGPGATPPEATMDLQRWLDQQEREVLLRTLSDTGFNRTAAAARLGLNLRQIRYRMARLGISAPGKGQDDDEPA